MTSLGRYRLDRVIGEGGMGVVHLAEAPDGERVAVKVLRQQVIGDREARDRLAREVSSLQLVQSRWVAEILDADPWGETPYVVTRYVPGRSLHQVISSDGPLQGEDLRWLAQGLLEGISAVHRAGVLHRDIKPSNVLMEGRTPVLIDFGLARVADDPRLTQTGWLLGTPGYLAPEVLFGDDPTPAVDVHAWAATVAFAAMGRPPFGTGPSMAIMDRTRRGEHDLTGIEPELRAVLESALDPDPSRRPTVEQLMSWVRRQSADPTSVHRLVLPPEARRTEVLPGGAAAAAAAAPAGAPSPAYAPVATAYEPMPTTVEPFPGAAAAPVGTGERARRAVLWFLLIVGWSAAIAAFPWIGLTVLLGLVWLLRSSSIAATKVGARRAERGARWHDGPRLVLGAPVDLARALPATIVLALWALGMVVVAVLICYAVAAPVTLSLVLAAAAAVLALLLGPGGGQVRSPIARVLNPLAAQPKSWLIATLVLMAIAGVCGGFAALGAEWAPFSGAPFDGLDSAAR